MRRAVWVATASAALVLGACKGDAAPRAGGAGKAAGGAAAGKPVAAAPVGTLPQGVARDVGEKGRDLYLAACVMCHGESAGGTALGPSLTDATWLSGTGAFEEITAVTRDGVATPREFPVPMPARGDGHFTDEQIRAVAAYTYSIANSR